MCLRVLSDQSACLQGSGKRAVDACCRTSQALTVKMVVESTLHAKKQVNQHDLDGYW